MTTLFNDDILQSMLPNLKGRNEGLVPLDREILSASVASITISSIVQDFTHLFLIGNFRSNRSAENDNLRCRFNSDATGYDEMFLDFNNSATSYFPSRNTTSIALGKIEANNSRANNFSPIVCVITDYTNTSNEKWITPMSSYTFGDVSTNADLYLSLGGGRWRDTSAITSITLLPQTGTLILSGSSVYLFGVA